MLHSKEVYFYFDQQEVKKDEQNKWVIYLFIFVNHNSVTKHSVAVMMQQVCTSPNLLPYLSAIKVV